MTGAEQRASESELREALWGAHRALLHADKWLDGRAPIPVEGLIRDSLREVAAVLDKGRDESMESGGT